MVLVVKGEILLLLALYSIITKIIRINWFFSPGWKGQEGRLALKMYTKWVLFGS